MKYLVHVDGKLPNLALMRLSTYFKERGEVVDLVRGSGRRTLFDAPVEVYASSIFGFSNKLRAAVDQNLGPGVVWGGTGLKPESNLSEIDPNVDWDGVKPDYSLYPDFRFSIGFSQRGCRLKCKFCVVPTKEGGPRSVSYIDDLWRGDPHPKEIILLDNDFFGQAEWQEKIEEIKEGRFKVSFCQGINIRQVNDSVASALASIEYRDNEFSRRILYTAWDSLGDEAAFKSGAELLRQAGIPPKHLMVYMLIGYRKGETWEDIFHRFNELVAMGCKPYPMVYNNERKDLKAFQKWVVMRYYQFIPWEKFIDPRLAGCRSGEST